MSPLTTLRLAVAGNRSDTTRIVLTGIGAALGTVTLLAAATVVSIVTPAGLRVTEDGQAAFDTPDGVNTVDPNYVLPYSNALLSESGLRPGVAFALLMLTIPILTFVGQCSRLGAPARDRRLAAIRMAGGTPQQVARIAAAETGVASMFGVVLGFGIYLLGRILLDNPDARGTRPLPTDVLAKPGWMITIAVGVPLLVTLFAVFALRRVAITPLGVVRGTRVGRPSITPGILLALGIGAFAVVEPLNQYFARQESTSEAANYVLAGVMFIGVVLVSSGVVAGTGWITYVIGRLLHRFGRRPATLLAGRRMMADPWSGSRTFAAMLVALIIGAIAAGVHSWTMTEYRASEESGRRLAEQEGQPYFPSDNSFFDRAYELIGYAVVVAVVIAAAGLLVALADSIVARRRTLSALVAGGTPRGVLARALGWQVLAPVVPAVLLAVSVGVLLPWRVMREVKSGQTGSCQPLPGDPVDACTDQAYWEAHGTVSPEVVLAVPVPWEQLALLAGGALAATAVITAVGLLFLRMSTAVGEIRAA